ncbi:uncharacterized protein DUF2752 [Lutibacter sp. Hel_I_33_5]|uniref:DUF2752 domain-containing protein n=1 Tax=Lutibacter sp. Hel_I_33_5 TaxID=1566289 RepID=UPI0011A3BF29|nr:DUF2752 domain-containing protein [Lutibacter sp. Hel_I_33_5]TVZ54788.1 uncharacterized protein DUF2752 [Lutibacter sp. Hel_I_33_5]
MFLGLEEYMIPCINKQLFGFDCPGCGIQRALLFLIKGEFVAAFKMYPAIYTLITFAGFVLINMKIKFKYAQKIILYLTIINIIIILTNYIIKLNS